MTDVNEYSGICDNEVIENAIKNKGEDGIIIIPPRKSDIEPQRDWWSLDKAILIPENTIIVLKNCKIKLSDKCRDNFFRTANCGMGISYPKRITNVHIKGEGFCLLEGADHPRATGDGGKILTSPCPYENDELLKFADWLSEKSKNEKNVEFWDRHSHSYGTDFGNQLESQYGDWRGIGILLANVDKFSIENVTIKDSHGWGISLEECSNGRIEKITFDACMSKIIDGMRQNMENQDGIDIRNGCHDILINDVSGHTGDDLIALTAIASYDFMPGGTVRNTHVMHSDWSKREKDIYNIIIRNVKGYSNLCYLIRLLPVNTKIYNVIIDGIIDTSDDSIDNFGGILLGTDDSGYGKNLEYGMKNISISNVICNSKEAIIIAGFLSDSVISNVISKTENCPVISIRRENGMKNVITNGLLAQNNNPIAYTETPTDYPV